MQCMVVFPQQVMATVMTIPFMKGGWHGAMDIVQEPAIEDLGWRPFLLLCPLSL